MDKDKVLQALNMCEGHDCHCDITYPKCPYLREDDKHANYGFPRCFDEMKKDILAMLKEQEGQRPTKQASALMADHHYYACPKCGCMVDYLVWKCYACNQRLNWD